MGKCPICGSRATIASIGIAQSISCPRCGEYELGDRAKALADSWRTGTDPQHPSRGKFSASHRIRGMQNEGARKPVVSDSILPALWMQRLPNPQQQADNFILVLGDAGLAHNEFVRRDVWALCAQIGTEDDPIAGTTGGLNMITEQLTKKGFIKHDPFPKDGLAAFRLTFEGWGEYERLRRVSVDSKVAFMAMGYGNRAVDRIVTEHFVPAVRDAGFDLFRLDQRPRSGLIDARLRVEIRAARFLVCDLTDDNRGAYWEAGFAEGLGKPVFYTCEKSKFESAKTHFDTEHMFTVVWTASDPGAAASELTAVIRNELPSEATPPDLTKRT